MENYNSTINLNSTVNRVFNALTNEIPRWWTEMFAGSSAKSGEHFTINFGETVYKKMRVEELIYNKKVVWYVEDSLIVIPGLINQTEWIGTKIVWEITQKGNHVEIHLTHIGLIPTIECYAVCTDGWRQFTASLKLYLETGAGTPFVQPLLT